MDNQQEQTTHFGFKTVKEKEKASLVRGVFASVAPKYDVMNDAMSLGIHHLWKDTLISMLNPKAGSKLLDVAGGTGDVALRFLKKTGGADTGSHVTVCDINPYMLEEGRNRAINKNMLRGMEWVCGNAEALPVPDNSYDYYTIAFGIRNVTHIDKALAEAYRVLKPGGRFMCLEFSQVENPLFAKIYETYSFHIIPKLGKLLANDEASYQYLVESIRKFPHKEKFKQMIEEAGFTQASYRNLTNGIVAIHSGWRV